MQNWKYINSNTNENKGPITEAWDKDSKNAVEEMGNKHKLPNGAKNLNIPAKSLFMRSDKKQAKSAHTPQGKTKKFKENVQRQRQVAKDFTVKPTLK